MRRLLLTLPVALALTLRATVVGGAFAAANRSGIAPLPHWLKGAETATLDGTFGGAPPIHTFYISYPRKIAVIFEFKRVVICGGCSAPSNASLPRGRLIRVSFSRRTHRLSGALQFCESRGSLPPRAFCLRR